ncbi:hypothetical protein [Thermomonas sp. HDW16]|uniref:hypothetical protein n=1 Tax=Thermomonas sp. HDW16 TaxID=2714945 RepID=UPI00140E85E0|nr:hypothetical protein [Thermomonas sp. HDW16]QIL19771.1 hypothetical protein G7079_02960 [Thermomonas sp. HDW16]
MAASLKDSYRWQLFAALAANLVLYYGLVKGLSLAEIRLNTALAHLAELLPSGLAVALCGIINAQLTPLQKARIIFLRWGDPLPGSRAFSHYAARDPRIDMRAVQAKWSPLPNDPYKQNALWYRIYQQEQETQAVRHLNRNWLFARDYACTCVLNFFVLGGLGIFQMPSLASWSIFMVIVAAQFLLARQSAVHHAERFITTVIAQAASKPGGANT